MKYIKKLKKEEHLFDINLKHLKIYFKELFLKLIYIIQFAFNKILIIFCFIF